MLCRNLTFRLLQQVNNQTRPTEADILGIGPGSV